MAKNFSGKTLALLLVEQIGKQFVVQDQEGVSCLIYERKSFLRIFTRLAFVAKVCTESYDHVTAIVGNPASESLVNRLAMLLVAEFKTINRKSGEPGSIVVDFFKEPLR